MKLVRARVKSPEELPAWTNCCGQNLSALREFGEITVDLDMKRGSPIQDEYYQCGCGKRLPNADYFMNVTHTMWICLEFLDLDEGPA